MPNPQNVIGKGNRFKKGESGNPKGRPKLPDLTEALEKVMGQEKDGVSALEAVLMALRKKATTGDVRAAEVLLNRGYGLPKQTVASQQLDENGNPINPNTHTVIIQAPKKKDDPD